MKKVDKSKIRLFAQVYNLYFTRVVWSTENMANEYLNEIGSLVYKHVDLVSTLVKSYCYSPTAKHIRVMRNSWNKTTGSGIPKDKVECAPHYMAAKNNFKDGVTFCSECNNPACYINRNMCIIVVKTAEFIERLRNLEDGKRVHFSMKDFFNKQELEHFIEYFTKPYYPITDEKYKLKWSSKVSFQIRLDNIVLYRFHTE